MKGIKLSIVILIIYSCWGFPDIVTRLAASTTMTRSLFGYWMSSLSTAACSKADESLCVDCSSSRARFSPDFDYFVLFLLD